MGLYLEWAEAFTIFDKYKGQEGVAVEYDVVYAGPDPDEVSESDKTRLEQLGWLADEVQECFVKNL